jgi:hypothetical protein
LSWWCFERKGLRVALHRYVEDEMVETNRVNREEAAAFAAEVERFLYSEQMEAIDGVRGDKGERDFS